jgi:AcrR family transcriptional regulator
MSAPSGSGVQSGSLREQVLDAAESEFAAHGFSGARVDLIGRLARVSKGTIYYHFRSKRLLYQQVLRRAYSSLTERMGAINDIHCSPLEKLSTVVTELGKWYMAHPNVPVLFLRELCEGGKNLDVETFEVFSNVPRLFLGIMRQGVADGSMREVPMFVAYYCILGPVGTFFASTAFRKRASKHLGPNVYQEGGHDDPSQFITDFSEFLAAVLPSNASTSILGPPVIGERVIDGPPRPIERAPKFKRA